MLSTLLARSRATWICATAVAASAVAQVVWVRVASPLSGVDSIRAIDEPFSALFRQSVGRAYDDKLQMVAAFGWLDTASPQITYVFWIAAASAVVLLGIGLARRWPAVVVGGLIVSVVLVPVLIESMGAPRLGFIWQGRYTLPLAVGVPLLATGLAGDRAKRMLSGSRFYGIVGVMLFVAQIAGLYQALRRYSVGESGALRFWSVAQWSPPVPSLVLLIVFSVALALFLWLLLGPRPPDRRLVQSTALDGNGHPLEGTRKGGQIV